MFHPFHVLDVFTKVRFGGNPLAVVLDAGDLDTEVMQAVAREFNLSETVFVCPPEGGAAQRAKVRIFTPAAELPFAGHPTVGTAVLLANLAAGGEAAFEREIVLEEQVGAVHVEVSRRAGETPFARFTSPVIPEASGDVPSAATLAATIGLAEDEIGCASHRPGSFKAGVEFVYIPVRDLAAVQRAAIHLPNWQGKARAEGRIGAYIYTLGGESPDAAFHVRMFAPDAGVMEDPATGAAAAIFPGQILASEAPTDGSHRWLIEQGYEMGRPSQIHLEADISDGALAAVRVGGHAVRVSHGEIEI